MGRNAVKGKPRPGVDRYRSVFDHCAVSLWEEDISELREMIKGWRDRGIRDIRGYLAGHPGVLKKAIQGIRVVNVNDMAVRLYEAKEKEQLLGPLDGVLPKEAIPSMTEYVVAIAEGREGLETDTVAMTFTGRRLDLFVKVFIPAEGDEYPYALASILDISARKRAEESERRSGVILRSVVESIPESVFVKDASLRMVLCNTALSHAIGKEPQETYGKTDVENGWSVDLVKGNAERGIVGWEKDDLGALQGKTIRAAAEPSDFDNGIRYFDTSKAPLRDQDGSVIGLVGIGRDVTDRMRAEADLRHAKEFAENLINTANVMVLALDLEGRVTIFNRAAEELTGYTRAEMMGRNWFETMVPRERYPEVWKKFQALLHAADVGVFENPILTRSGEERYVAWNNSHIREGSRVTGTLSFGIDITDRRRLEEDLAWERSLFNTLMDEFPDPIYFKDRESRFTRVSRSHAQALGLKDPSEAVGKTDADFFTADAARKNLEDEKCIMKTGQPLVGHEEREALPGGPDTWFLTTKMPLRDREGRVAGTFGISHDISRRKRLEEKNQQLAVLVESVEDAIVGLDLDRRITVWNRGAERLYGYSAEEMIGAATSRLIPPELEEEARAFRERLARGEQISHFETTRLRKNGSRVDISLTLAAIRGPDGAMVGIASVARDITEQKALQARISRAQRLESLALLAGGVAHKFNNINTVVGSYLQLIQSEAGLPARILSYAEDAFAGVQRAVDITSRLLALTEPGAAHLDPVRLDVLARALLGRREKRIETEKVTLVSSLAETAPVPGDESRLGFVLLSIMDNALDSLLDRPARAVTVRTGGAKDSVFFEVEDSGCGLSEAEQLKLFTPFFSAKGEWAPRGSPQANLKGTGLSLAICNTIVSEHGGRIEVRSTKGAGSAFTVVLPIAR